MSASRRVESYPRYARTMAIREQVSIDQVSQILDDAKSGKINLILCKDLSRFGRNYIEVGQYIDYIFLHSISASSP